MATVKKTKTESSEKMAAPAKGKAKSSAALPVSTTAPVVPAAASGRKLVMDGVEYALEGLNESALQQLAQVRAVDAEIDRLKLQLTIANTARGVYFNALKQSLLG